MRPILLVAGAALACVAAAPAQAPNVKFSDVIAICRETFLHNPERGKQQFEALPEKTKPFAALICIAYRQGAVDLLQASGKASPDA
jgi:hypothetical protein